MSLAIVLLSGGLDSAVAAAEALAEGHDVIAISFRYGQRNARELSSAAEIASRLGIREHFITNVDLSQWGGSTLTAGITPVSTSAAASALSPTNHVPGRNTVFIAIALCLAEVRGADLIYLGFNAADALHPDTRPPYVEAFERLVSVGSKAGLRGKAPRLCAPFIHEDKPFVVRRALLLGVPIEATWSCDRAGEEPCGECGPCRLRDFALIKESRPDLATPKGRARSAEEAIRKTRLLWRFMLERGE